MTRQQRQELAVTERHATRYEGCIEQRPFGVGLVDDDGESFPGLRFEGWRQDLEPVGRLHADEGRDVKRLLARVPDWRLIRLGIRPGRNQIAVPLAERVVHLVEDGDQRPVAPTPAVEYAQRIEGIAQDARIAEQADPDVPGLQPGLRQLRFHPGPERRSVAGAKIAV